MTPSGFPATNAIAVPAMTSSAPLDISLPVRLTPAFANAARSMMESKATPSLRASYHSSPPIGAGALTAPSQRSAGLSMQPH